MPNILENIIYVGLALSKRVQVKLTAVLRTKSDKGGDGGEGEGDTGGREGGHS